MVQSLAQAWLPKLRLRLTYGVWAIVFTALAFAAFFADLPISQFLRIHPPSGDLRRLVMMGEAFGFGLSVGLIILTAVVLDARRRRQLIPRLLLLSFGSGLAANALKMMVARSRPLTIDLSGEVWSTFIGLLPFWKHGETWGYATQSFPSAHTATATGLAIGLAAFYPQGRWLFAGFAVLAGMQRVVSGAHFLSDSLIGAAVAFLLAAFFERATGKRDSQQRTAIE